MPNRTLKLSPKIKLLMDTGKLDGLFTDFNKESGEWYLGRHESNIGDSDAPLDRGFGKATTRVKKYPKYNPYYKAIRKPEGWLTQSGALKEYVRKSAEVIARPRWFKIVVPVKPKSEGPAAYAGIHQHGGQIEITDKMRWFFRGMFKETGQQLWLVLVKKKTPIKIPKREYLSWDAVDGRKWSRFAVNWLKVHLGFGEFEV